MTRSFGWCFIGTGRLAETVAGEILSNGTGSFQSIPGLMKELRPLRPAMAPKYIQPRKPR